MHNRYQAGLLKVTKAIFRHQTPPFRPSTPTSSIFSSPLFVQVMQA